jgi:uncharacterized protein (TIGR00369 family)
VPLRVNPAFESLNAILVEGLAGQVTVSFTVGSGTVQGNGVVGGGTIANMLDSAMAVAVLSMLNRGQTCSTISLNVSMLRGASPGELVTEARVDKLGSRVGFAHARLLTTAGRLVATASSTLAIL